MAVTQTTGHSTHLVADRYQLRVRLGSGSCATVYEATDVRFNRPVTLKLFDPAVVADPMFRARFQRQVAKAAQLQHPNIAAILDAGVDESGPSGPFAFVVSEPAGSDTLRDLLDRQAPLHPRLAVRLAQQLAAALGHAHALGVVHADVKPENVLVDERAQHARLVDFSLSFVSASTGVVTRDTIVRRAAYLAPEQVRGERVTAATDVYGLGVLLYEMVVGRPPFVGGTPEATAQQRVYENARPAGLFEPSIPPALESILERALARAPGQRWSSVDDFGRALGELDPTQLHPVDAVELPDERPLWPPKSARRLRRLWEPFAIAVPILAVVVACAIALGFLLPLLTGRSQSAAPGRKLATPQLTGMTVPEARALAQSRGLEVIVIGDRVTDRISRDRIIQQAPVAGWDGDPNEPIRVTVSSGVTVPDVRGKSLENARTALSELGWTIARVERGSYPGTPSGSIALQHPAPGGVVDAPGELALAVAE